MIEKDGRLWIPILPKAFLETLAPLIGIPPNELLRRKDEWPRESREEYRKLHAAFTAGKGEFQSWVRKDRDSRMTTTAKTITVFLIDSLNFDTGRCDPSHQTIADEIGIGVRQVERLMPRIAAAGWFLITRRGKTTTNFYRLGVPSEKVLALLDYTDSLREERHRQRAERLSRQPSDPTSMTVHPMSDPTSARTHDPTSARTHDPTSMTGKPMKRTTEEEPLNEIQGSDSEGLRLRAHGREVDPDNAYARAKGRAA